MLTSYVTSVDSITCLREAAKLSASTRSSSFIINNTLLLLSLILATHNILVDYELVSELIQKQQPSAAKQFSCIAPDTALESDSKQTGSTTAFHPEFSGR